MTHAHNIRHRFTQTLSAAALLVALGHAPSTQAADRFWDGGDGSWGTAANWDVGVPGTGDVAIFNDAGNNNVNQTITLDGARVVQGLTFNNTGTTQINQGTSGTLTLNNSGNSLITTAVGSGAVTIAPEAIFGTGGSGGAYTFNINGGSLTFNGLVGSPRTGPRTWEVNGGTVNFAGGFRLNSATSNSNNRINTVSGNGTLVISGDILRGGASDSSLETATGFAGILRLANAINDQNVAMIHKGGTLQFAGGVLPTLGLKWQGGALAAFGSARTINEFVDGNGSNSSLSITGNQDLTLNNFWLSSVSGGSPTANRTLTVTNTGITTLGSLSNSIRINPNNSTAVSHLWDIQDNAHLKIAGALTQVNVLGPSSITKSGNGILEMLVSTTYTVGTGGFAVSGGTLRVNNTSGSATSTATVTLAANSRLDGSGIISGAVSGAGSIHAGNSPGILTVGQINPADGMDFHFEFTQVGAPTWSSATASGNDVLRITNVTTPFTANLSTNNEINLYFSGTGTYQGGFFVEDVLEDFTANLAGATFKYYIAGTGVGAITYNSVSYLALGDGNVSRSLVAANDTFGGTVDGFTQQFVVIPEPGTLALVMVAGLAAVLSARKRRV